MYKSLTRSTRAVSLRLYPPPSLQRRVELPQEWLEAGWAWAGEGLEPQDEVSAALSLMLMEFPLRAGDVLAFWERCRRAQADTATVVVGDLKARYRGANADFMAAEPNLALGGGGAAAGDAELAGLVETFARFARDRAAEAAQAYVYVGPRPVFHGSYHVTPPGVGEAEWVEKFCDELVFDAFAWQVLGPGHLARLGARPPRPAPCPVGGWS